MPAAWQGQRIKRSGRGNAAAIASPSSGVNYARPSRRSTPASALFAETGRLHRGDLEFATRWEETAPLRSSPAVAARSDTPHGCYENRGSRGANGDYTLRFDERGTDAAERGYEQWSACATKVKPIHSSGAGRAAPAAF